MEHTIIFYDKDIKYHKKFVDIYTSWMFQYKSTEYNEIVEKGKNLRTMTELGLMKWSLNTKHLETNINDPNKEYSTLIKIQNNGLTEEQWKQYLTKYFEFLKTKIQEEYTLDYTKLNANAGDVEVTTLRGTEETQIIMKDTLKSNVNRHYSNKEVNFKF